MTAAVPASRSKPSQERKPPVPPLCQVIDLPFAWIVSQAAPMRPATPKPATRVERGDARGAAVEHRGGEAGHVCETGSPLVLVMDGGDEAEPVDGSTIQGETVL